MLIHIVVDKEKRLKGKYGALEIPQIDEVISTIDWAISNNIALLPGDDLQYLQKLRKSLILLMSKTLDRALSTHEADITKHDMFISNLSNLSETQGVDIISLNYDLLLDHAIYRKTQKLPHYGLNKKRPNTGYRLYKLHGSLNWAVCPFCQQIRTFSDKVAHKLFETQKRCQSCISTNLEPVLITPTMLKDYNIPELPRVWNEAFQALSTATKLVFVGYSLPPADFAIIELIKRAIHMKLRLEEVHVIDIDRDLEDRYKKIFGNKVSSNMNGFSGELL
ncbi:SIR2 family protein [Paenibacillus validus]|uniref:SIR2 family protein n=1 Tax=Paenibacillus validus TaxID=44253 RepID=UPI003D2CACF7